MLAPRHRHSLGDGPAARFPPCAARPAAFRAVSSGSRRDRRSTLLSRVVAIAVVVCAAAVATNEPLDFVNHLWVGVGGREGPRPGGPPQPISSTPRRRVSSIPSSPFMAARSTSSRERCRELSGHPYVAYAVVTVAAIAAAYVGTLCSGGSLACGACLPHAPALAVITSAYYITEPLRPRRVDRVHGPSPRYRRWRRAGARAWFAHRPGVRGRCSCFAVSAVVLSGQSQPHAAVEC